MNDNRKKDNKHLIIRNSTAEFLIFASQAKEKGIEVRYEGETIWLSQKLMAKLFDTSTDNIGLHLKNIYSELELDDKATSEDFSVVQQEGKFLDFDDRKILQDAGSISAKIAKEHAENEFEKFRGGQDREFLSDFDREIVKNYLNLKLVESSNLNIKRVC